LSVSAEEVVVVGCEIELMDIVRYVAFFKMKKGEEDVM